MSNIQTGAERMPHDLSHLGFLAGQIGRLITISTTPVIAGDSFEMDAVGALRLSPFRRGLAIDSTVDIFTFYVPHVHVFFFSSRRRHTSCGRDWSSDVCSSDLETGGPHAHLRQGENVADREESEIGQHALLHVGESGLTRKSRRAEGGRGRA